ncbi:hypothetical protein [Lutibacter sp.]|uniref:hypothetical protein n=1 Tax=Lutibacter sp. TaxID=1925666 RepID=UPI0027368388|nr:hypothetical protein [Lutibacter sp.]MDP3314386.1 hypothetical protein [Lutibacter sp.]
MKIKDEYPNFKNALLFYIGDKNPKLVSDDSIKISYYIPLRNFDKGFDYYELTRLKNGLVYFSIVTMLGFKSIVQSDTKAISSDISESEWQSVIYETSLNHFSKEEYVALKKGYVKKKSGGCLVSALLSLIFVFMLIGIFN